MNEIELFLIFLVSIFKETIPFSIFIIIFLFYLYVTKKIKVFIYSLLILSIALIIIFIPNISSCGGDRPIKISSVKANMYSLNTMLEKYSENSNGCYPKNIKLLEIEAKKGKYWKELKNPYSHRYDAIDINITKNMERLINEPNIGAGYILYKPQNINNSSNCIKKYYLYGTYKKIDYASRLDDWFCNIINCNSKNVWIIKDKNEIFTLTNEKVL